MNQQITRLNSSFLDDIVATIIKPPKRQLCAYDVSRLENALLQIPTAIGVRPGIFIQCQLDSRGRTYGVYYLDIVRVDDGSVYRVLATAYVRNHVVVLEDVSEPRKIAVTSSPRAFSHVGECAR